MRIGWLTNAWKKLDQGIEATTQAAIAALKKDGASIAAARLPEGPFEDAANVIVAVEGASAFASLIESGRIAELDDRLGRIAGYVNEHISASDYLRALRVRGVLQRKMDEMFRDFAVLAAAALPITATSLETSLETELSFPDPLGGIGNLCGLPAISVPCGFRRDASPDGAAVRRPRPERPHRDRRRPSLPATHQLAHQAPADPLRIESLRDLLLTGPPARHIFSAIQGGPVELLWPVVPAEALAPQQARPGSRTRVSIYPEGFALSTGGKKMSKRVFFLLAAFVLCLLAPAVASAQQQEEPPTFTFVAEWGVPRAQWANFVDFNEKNGKQVLDKLLADGTIIGYGTYATIVHQEERETHGTWFEATSIANLEKALGELLKLPPNPAIITGAKHHDILLRSLLYRSKPAKGTNGYLWVSSTQLQPGKGQEWRELFDKYTKPVYEELLANGTILAYWIDVEQVHTDNPNWRHVVYLTANADAIGKVGAAFEAAGQKRGPDANRGIARAFADITVAGAHRDYFARVTNYARK